jgi:hypothetical protein
MKTASRFTLEPYKGMNTRYRCPSCQQRDKTFSLYIDTETGEHIHPTVGRCNSESYCGYHYTPKQYFQENNILTDNSQPKAYQPRPFVTRKKEASFIPVEVFKASLKGYEGNCFVNYLVNLFGAEIASELVSTYWIGSSDHWKGATVFWQVDAKGKIRTGKIMLYSPITGKRAKNLDLPIYWVHKALKQPEFDLRQCLFGEHLLKDQSKPVAIVESEKTAIIASVYLPQFIWVAVGSLTNLNAERCSALRGRSVILFPDLSLPKQGKPTAFEKWSDKAREFSNLASFKVSDLLERKASDVERGQGFDLADYLCKFDYKGFLSTFCSPKKEGGSNQIVTRKKEEENSQFADREKEEQSDRNGHHKKEVEYCEQIPKFIDVDIPAGESWGQEVAELESYFAGLAIPDQPIKLNHCTTIKDYSNFLESHFATLKANDGKKTFAPYLNRLQDFRQAMVGL